MNRVMRMIAVIARHFLPVQVVPGLLFLWKIQILKLFLLSLQTNLPGIFYPQYLMCIMISGSRRVYPELLFIQVQIFSSKHI